MKKVIIVGAGGFGREVYSWARQHPDYGVRWTLDGFLDDKPDAMKGTAYEALLIGRIDEYQPVDGDLFLCGVGNPEIKKKACLQLLARGAEFISLIHPTAVLGSHVRLGKGVILCPRTTLTCDIEVGDFVVFNCASGAGHDVRVGDWSQISSHCDLMGGVVLGESVFVGSHAMVLPDVHVGSHAVIGAGSCVLRSVPERKTVFGVPAVPLK